MILQELAEVAAILGAWVVLWCYVLPQRSRCAAVRWLPVCILLLIVLPWVNLAPREVWAALFVVFASHTLATEFRNWELLKSGRTGSNIWAKALEWIFLTMLSFFLLSRPNAFLAPPNLQVFVPIILLVILIHLAFLKVLKRWAGFLYYHGYISSARMGHLSCLLTSLTEEYAFRGIILWSLASYLPLWAAILIQSVLFGLSHLRMGTPSGLAGALQTFMLGLLLGTITVVTGTFVYGILLHTVLPIGKKATQLLWDCRRRRRSGPMELLGCLCQETPCLCQEAGRFRIPIATHVAQLLIRESGGASLSSARIAELAAVTALRGMKDTPRLLREIAIADITIHFDKSISTNSCRHWSRLSLAEDC